MKKFKLYQFALALVAAVLVSAAASEINTAYAAPVASASSIQHAVPTVTEEVQGWRRRNRRGYIGPAIALGVFGTAAVIASQQNRGYYGPGYYEPNYYYRPARQRCFVQTDPYGRGYYTWC